jgi:hypothetical protein
VAGAVEVDAAMASPLAALFDAARPLEPLFALLAPVPPLDVAGAEAPLPGLAFAPRSVLDIASVEAGEGVDAPLFAAEAAAVFVVVSALGVWLALGAWLVPGTWLALGAWLALVAVELLTEAVALGEEPAAAAACEEDCVGGFGGRADGAALVASSNAANGWVSVCCA